MPSPYAFTVGDQVLFDPMPGPQVEFLTATEPNVFIYGNRGGGKSITLRMWCHGEALAKPGLVYVIVRKGYPELHLNHLMFLDDEMSLFGGTYNKTEHVCYYPNGSIGVYRQCAQEADIKKIVGAQASIIGFDEAPELEWEWIRLIGASVRVTKEQKARGIQPKVRYLGNPIGPSIDELWSYFIDKDVDRLLDPHYNPADFRAIEIKMQDNAHLDVDSYMKQFAGIPEHIRKAWVDGIRVVNGAYFVIDPKRHHTLTRPPLHGHVDPITGFIHPAPHIYRAIDWGWHDQTVCLWIAVYPNGRAIVFRELVRTHTPAKEIASLIKSMSTDVHVRDTFCDPSMFPPDQHDVELEGNIIENCGIPLTPSRNDRIACGFSISEWLNTPLEDGLPALQFWQPGCPVLCKTLPSMRMDPKKPERIADSPKDHATITLGYFCMGHKLAPKIKAPGMNPTRISNLIKHASLTPSKLGQMGVRRR
jgi:hypothetical protein